MKPEPVKDALGLSREDREQEAIQPKAPREDGDDVKDGTAGIRVDPEGPGEHGLRKKPGAPG